MFAMGHIVTKAQVVLCRGSGIRFIRRWRGPLLAFSASKVVIFCNRVLLRYFLTSPHVTRSRMTFDPQDVRVVRPSIHARLSAHMTFLGQLKSLE